MTEYDTFMVYELDDSGEKNRISITEEELHSNLHPEQVLVIVREDLRRIFIWKGPKSPVRKRFISSRVAQELQDDLRKSAAMHRCKIVSVDAGDEPSEFLNAFQLDSMEVTERLADMRYVRNIEKERISEAVIKDVVPETKEEYVSPTFQDSSTNVVSSPHSKPAITPTASPQNQYPKHRLPTGGLSKDDYEKIKEKILKTEISDSYKRLNLISGHTLFAAVSKVAKVFGEEVEETEWEPVKKVPKEVIELDNHLLRIYFNKDIGIVEAVEILEKSGQPTSIKKKLSSESTLTPMPAKPNSMEITAVDFNSLTVKDLKKYAEEKNIDLPANLRKAEIIEILEKSKKNNPGGRRQLPKIPSKDD
ncbi:MAG: hypothetical protein ACFFA3_05805 [Promethearchaeota archaeon]